VKEKKTQSKIEDSGEFKPGDTICVYQKGYSPFKGVVIVRHGGESPSATFTVRAVLSGVGVEKIYPLRSPLIKIKKLKSGKTRRAKLYFLRRKI
jgi:large subunit ribosomal protein L19